MIVAIGIQINNSISSTSVYTPCRYPRECKYNDHSNVPNSPDLLSILSFQSWFMIVAGYVLPIVGVWLFFSVTHYWLQEFAIGITIDYLSILKLPGALGLLFPNGTPHEAREKANKILLYTKYGTPRQDYHALRNENPLVKAWYPFKSFSHTLICLAYTIVQAIFIFVAAINIPGGDVLTMGLFLFAIITEVLSNILYVLLVALFWLYIAAHAHNRPCMTAVSGHCASAAIAAVESQIPDQWQCRFCTLGIRAL